MIGQTISHYKILEKIGEGGMGEVFLAEDTSLDRKVALKFLPDFMQQDPVAEKRFLREAKSVAALDHSFICHIHEIGETDGRGFIAMECVEGLTLKSRNSSGSAVFEGSLGDCGAVGSAAQSRMKRFLRKRRFPVTSASRHALGSGEQPPIERIQPAVSLWRAARSFGAPGLNLE